MADTWDMPLTAEQRAMFEQWSADDPVNDIERIINRKVCREQGNSNPHVRRLRFDSALGDCAPAQ